MALQNTDLFLVNRTGTNYNISYQNLKTSVSYTLPAATAAALGGVKQGTNITIAPDGTISANLPGALIYKGTVDPTAAAPAGVQAGWTYVASKAGALDASYGALAGTNVASGDMLLYTGTAWDHVGSSGTAGTLTDVTADAPITVTKTNPAQPHLAIAAATPSTAGAGGTPGVMTAADKEKLDGISAGAAAGTVTTVTATAPLHVATPTSTPALTIDAATTTAPGVVRLADAAAVTNGTAGRVVTADQLKTTNDAITAASAGGITGLTGTAPMSVTGPTTAKVVAIADASTTAKGAVQLADTTTAVSNGTLAATMAAVNAKFLQKDISTLAALP